MRALLAILLLAGGEIVLALIALRVAVWVLRGWRACRRVEAAGRPPPEPPRGLRALAGGKTRERAEPRALRPAA